MPQPATSGREPPAISKGLARELEQYRGRWVAVDKKKNQITGSGHSAQEAIDASVLNGVTKPLVFRVPGDPRAAQA